MIECRFSRSGIAALGLALTLGTMPPAGAQELLPDPEAETPELPSGPLAEEEAVPEGAVLSDPQAETDDRLRDLYAELGDPENARWQQTEDAIWRAWSRSGSAAMDLLLRRADSAAGEGDLDVALKFLNDLVRLAPDFAEGWNKRATVFFMQGKLGRSIADIERTLALEPRHFGALSGLAVILEETGNQAGALRAWRRALEIHPHLEGASEGVKRLVPDVEGRPL